MLLCCYASDLVIKYRNFMAQEVTAHSGCEKYPNYHFLRVLSQERHGWVLQLLSKLPIFLLIVDFFVFESIFHAKFFFISIYYLYLCSIIS